MGFYGIWCQIVHLSTVANDLIGSHKQGGARL